MLISEVINGLTLFDKEAQISFTEFSNNLLNHISRIYTIKEVKKDAIRGFHAHKLLKQILFCPQGEIEILLDDGFHKEKHSLSSPDALLFVGPGVWHEMIWKKENSVLCVVASDKYDEEDYIRNYNTFIKMVKEGYWSSNEN